MLSSDEFGATVAFIQLPPENTSQEEAADQRPEFLER